MAQCNSCLNSTIKTQSCGCGAVAAGNSCTNCICPGVSVRSTQPLANPCSCFPVSNYLDVGTNPSRGRGRGCGCGCGGTATGATSIFNASNRFQYRAVPDLLYGGESTFFFDGTSTVRRYIRPTDY